MSSAQADFVAGFVARHAAAPERLRAVLEPAPGFAAARPVPGSEPIHFAPRAAPGAPRHFSPADRGSNPTEGWNPLDPSVDNAPAIDPLAAAHAAGYAEGLAAAAANASDVFARDHALLADIAATLGSAGRVDRAAMAGRLRQTVMLLLSRLIGEVGVSPELLSARVGAAAELLADKSESALLRVHPDDADLLDGKLPESIFAAGDPSLARGSFVLESASTVVEDGPELWLEQLAQAIDRVPVPAPC